MSFTTIPSSVSVLILAVRIASDIYACVRQAEVLKRLRAGETGSGLHETLLVTVQGIAAGMQNTG